MHADLFSAHARGTFQNSTDDSMHIMIANFPAYLFPYFCFCDLYRNISVIRFHDIFQAATSSILIFTNQLQVRPIFWKPPTVRRHVGSGLAKSTHYPTAAVQLPL